ncbi:MAG: septum site-determining protein MinC [Gammaproteobacteria bacterium]|nr:septum site-determining protein MinC [Gammaproteobacteria bacterium]
MTLTLNSAPSVLFKSRSISIPTLNIYSDNIDLIKLSFKEQLKQTTLFKNASVILDLSNLETPIDALKLINICHEQSIYPIATQGGNQLITDQFKKAGIRKLSDVNDVKDTQTSELVITKTVRSGQEIYSEKPIVILGDVSAAAEVASNASIHIYGELRGKAMAGVRGDTSAHIFASSSQAELVAIGKQFISAEQSNIINFKTPSRFTIMDKKIKAFNL